MTVTPAVGARLRWIVAVCAADGQVAALHACQDTREAVALHRELTPRWPGHTVAIWRPGGFLALFLEGLADQLAAAALAGGEGGTDDERARRDGIAAAAVVIRARADAVRGWAP